MKLLILLKHRFELWNPPEWFVPRLKAEFPQLEVVHLRDYERAKEEIRDAEILISWSLRSPQFLAAKKLRWVHSTAAAVHALLTPELIASDVIVTNASSVHGPVVAEHAMALIFALAKRLPTAVRQQQARHWGQTEIWSERPRPREVAGSTVTVIGYGAIGREVARLACAVGMNVVVVRRNADHRDDQGKEENGPSLEIVGRERLEEALARGDFVVLAAPLTPETERMMDARRIGCMKRDAYLVNVARGALVDEGALVESLRAGGIGGAALDVFATEPLPPESPLWEAPNVLVTPHSASFTDRIWFRHYELFTENLKRYLKGERLRNVIDKGCGY